LKLLTDANDETAISGKTTGNVFTFRFKEVQTFNVLALQENIRKGQRIEQFVLEYWVDGEWKKAAEGTTVGYKRLLRFEDVTATQVRLRILSSRLEPHLAEMGLYFANAH